MAAEFPDRKEQLVFLINNYDMMLAVLTVREMKRRDRDNICMCCRNRKGHQMNQRNLKHSNLYFMQERKNLLKK